MNKRRLITGIIYCYTNKINGKKYIGQTIDEKKRRIKFFNLKQRYGGRLIDNARKKYNSSDYWDYDVLNRKQYLTEEDASFDLDLLEIFYIDKFNSYNNGYNLTDGGGNGILGYKFSDEQKSNISKGLKGKYKGENHPFFGKHHSEQTKEKLSKANKGKLTGLNNPRFGKHLSEETKEKLRNQRIGKHLSEETKNKISEATKGERNPNFGKRWTSEMKNALSEKKQGIPIIKNRKQIYQINSSTNEIIAEFDSLTEAEQKTGIKFGNISKALRNYRGQTKAGGFKWRYKES